MENGNGNCELQGRIPGRRNYQMVDTVACWDADYHRNSYVGIRSRKISCFSS
jgi:hypothetical protein